MTQRQDDAERRLFQAGMRDLLRGLRTGPARRARTLMRWQSARVRARLALALRHAPPRPRR
jgi:hypothetical protein